MQRVNSTVSCVFTSVKGKVTPTLMLNPQSYCVSFGAKLVLLEDLAAMMESGVKCVDSLGCGFYSVGIILCMCFVHLFRLIYDVAVSIFSHHVLTCSASTLLWWPVTLSLCLSCCCRPLCHVMALKTFRKSYISTICLNAQQNTVIKMCVLNNKVHGEGTQAQEMTGIYIDS